MDMLPSPTGVFPPSLPLPPQFGPPQVALSSHERAELDKSMQDTGGISGVRDALLGMDVMEAEAQDPADAEKIKDRIRDIGVPAVNQLLRSSMAEAYVEQMPTDMTHFALSGGVLGAYMCFYCCILLPLSIAAIVYAVIGPCATVYRLCVALVGAYGLSTLIPTVPLLSHMAKLIHASASAGVGGWRAVVIARRKLGSAIGTVAKSAMYGLTAGITGLIVSGMVAIAKQGCRPMCSVMWVIVAVMAVIVPVAATRQVSSFSKSAIMDEEDADARQLRHSRQNCHGDRKMLYHLRVVDLCTYCGPHSRAAPRHAVRQPRFCLAAGRSIVVCGGGLQSAGRGLLASSAAASDTRNMLT